jgi:hypothetical protein
VCAWGAAATGKDPTASVAVLIERSMYPVGAPHQSPSHAGVVVPTSLSPSSLPPLNARLPSAGPSGQSSSSPPHGAGRTSLAPCSAHCAGVCAHVRRGRALTKLGVDPHNLFSPRCCTSFTSCSFCALYLRRTGTRDVRLSSAGLPLSTRSNPPPPCCKPSTSTALRPVFVGACGRGTLGTLCRPVVIVPVRCCRATGPWSRPVRAGSASLSRGAATTTSRDSLGASAAGGGTVDWRRLDLSGVLSLSASLASPSVLSLAPSLAAGRVSPSRGGDWSYPRDPVTSPPVPNEVLLGNAQRSRCVVWCRQRQGWAGAQLCCFKCEERYLNSARHT